MVRTFIVIKDNKIEKILQSDQIKDEIIQHISIGSYLQEVPNNFKGKTGEGIDLFDNNWERILTKDLINKKIRNLSPYEKYNEENDSIILKSWKEMIEEGIFIYNDWLNNIVRPYRNQLLNNIDLYYCNPERWNSYSWFKKRKWKKYKQQLRDFTKLNLQITDNIQELDWPKMPI